MRAEGAGLRAGGIRRTGGRAAGLTFFFQFHFGQQRGVATQAARAYHKADHPPARMTANAASPRNR